MNSQILLNKGQILAKYLALKEIHLWESRCSRDISFIAKKVDVPLEIEVNVLNSTSKNILPFASRFTIIATDKETQRKAFEIQATFCVVYTIQGDHIPDKDETEAFGATNVVFNVWPYAREFIQNSNHRMGLPPFTLPPITIGQLAKIGSSRGGLMKCGN